MLIIFNKKKDAWTDSSIVFKYSSDNERIRKKSISKIFLRNVTLTFFNISRYIGLFVAHKGNDNP